MKNEAPDPVGEEVDEVMNEEESEIESTNSMKVLLASARTRAAQYEAASENENDEMEEDASNDHDEINFSKNHTVSHSTFNEFSRRAFDKVFKTVLSFADILFYVLDVRDSNGTRFQKIERQITAADSGSKRLILILNKIDLVPPTIFKS